MRTMTIIGLTVITVVAGAAWAGPSETPTDKPRWLSDFAAAQTEARRSGRPILAVLH